VEGNAQVIPLIKGAALKLDNLEQSDLVKVAEQHRTATNEWLRHQIVDNNRLDILGREILGYTIKPFHLRMIQWQFEHPQSLQLSYRGSGKSWICTILKVIGYFCKNRNLRILLGSESMGNTSGFLRVIRGHFERNKRLIEVFGKFYDPHVVTKWTDTELEVVGKTEETQEVSITCAGVDSSITSKHFDILISDDLVTRANARTPRMRDKVREWYLETYTPMLLAPSSEVEHRGEHHHLGTRYHFNDLYGHLMENELKGHTQIIPALDEFENSPWPEKDPPEHFRKLRREKGIIIFSSQYQCDTEAMKGEIFQYDDCQELDDEEWPDRSEVKIFGGTDLASSERDRKENAQFAMVIIGIRGSIRNDDYYVYFWDWFLDHLRPTKHEEKVLEYYDLHDPIRMGIESNQYQDSLRMSIKEKRPNCRVVKLQTMEDKISRAWKRAGLFENQRVFFRKGIHDKLIEQFLLFPSQGRDIFDAFDLALRAAKRRPKKRKERQEFGVI